MDFHRLFDIPPYQLAKYPKEVALAGRRRGEWRTYSTQKLLDHMDRLSAGLLREGLQKGDRAAILADCGSPLWIMTDLALQQIGVTVVPVHPTTTSKDLAFIFEDARIKCCFVSNEALLEKVNEVTAGVLTVFSFSKTDEARHTKDLLADPSEEELNQLKNLRSGILPGDLATIIYTSGTTGTPKGVMLSHHNIVCNIKAIMTLVPVNHHKQAISFLPMSHIFERMVTFLYMAAGTSVWYCEDVKQLATDAREIRPHFLTVVPRVLEKVCDQLQNIRQEKGPWGKKLMDWAIRRGERFDPLEKLSPVYWVTHQFLDLLVYRRWRKILGGRLDGIVVGAAALQPKINRLFCAAGIPVREGYGLTESAPVVSFNHFEPGLYRFGTVGIPIPGVEVRIESLDESGEGEILVRGPNVMMGYLNLPNETAAVLSEDGWLRTGDIGRFVHRRFLQITDRKRDFFKTSSGKYVAPQKVENHLKSSAFISQVMVTGLNKPYVAALIVPEFNALEAWCRENEVHWTAPQFMVLNPVVQKHMQTLIDELNTELEPHEQVRRFTLLHEEWTPENGGLTFTMKVDRRLLGAWFDREIKSLYEYNH